MRVRRAVLAAAAAAAVPAQVELVVEAPRYERNMNEEQLDVIRHESGPLACFAGAGSGKTRALVHRVVRLVEKVGVPGDRIFCVTFSRAGAAEMTKRIHELGCSSVNVQTWHAFCARVLREEGTPQGGWTVDEKDKAKTFVKQAIGYRHENWIGADLTKVRRFIGHCKANLWDALSEEAFELAKRTFGGNAQKAVRVFDISQRLIEEAGLLTFDDMLVFTARHFEQNDDARRAWAAKFDQVLQDEAQDANRAQKVLATMLSQEHRNYMIVGDPGQSIYAFRGSSPAYLTDFPEEWSAKIVTMNRNYRSVASVIRYANDVIREGEHKLPLDMTCERGEEGSLRVVSADTLDDESRELVDFVKQKITEGKSPNEICVLYRLNAQSRALEDALLKEKIPYVIIGGTNFYERKEVKDLLAYLRLAAQRDREGDAVRRCINAPFRFLGAKFVEKVDEAKKQEPEISWESAVLRAANQERIQERQRASAFDWVKLVEKLRAQIADGVPRDTALPSGEAPKMRPATAFDVLSEVVRTTRYIEWLEKEEGEESVENSHAANVRELLRVAQSFTSVGELLDYVEKQVAESAQNKRAGKGRNALTMMTIHKSKGLEWPIVWIVGCNESILPHIKGDPEEERRMMYVAATRARDELVISHVREMAMRTGLKTVDRSRFLDSLDRKDEHQEAIERDVEEARESREIAVDRAIAEDAETRVSEMTIEECEKVWAQPADTKRLVAAFGEGTCGACEKSITACEC